MNPIAATKKVHRAESQAVETAAATALKVMVVDDDPSTTLVMSELLSSVGFEVDVAHNGLEAVEHVQRFMPDLILLDIDMPKLDGISACAEIRKCDNREFPIVMVTNVDDATSIQRAFDAGATDFILKPINWPLLQRRLESILAEWRSTQKPDRSEQLLDVLDKVGPELVFIATRRGDRVDILRRRHGETFPASPSLNDLFSEATASAIKQKISGVLKSRQSGSLEFEQTEHGTTRQYETKLYAEGRDKVLCVVEDVSESRRTLGEVYELAYVDKTTKLPNENLLHEKLEETLVDARLHGDHFSVILVSQTGETHEVVDRKTLGRSLARYFGRSRFALPLTNDGGNEPVAYVDGGKFAAVLRNVHSQAYIQQLCEGMIDAVCEMTGATKAELGANVFVGVASFPADGKDIGAVLSAVEAAAQEAVAARKFVCFSTVESSAHLQNTLDYEAELKRAMEDEQFVLHYQPRVCVSTGKVTCVEALLRWHHPFRGFVSLAEMLPYAEATGLMPALGNWVLNAACRQAADWSGAAPPRVAVNLSQQEFRQADLPDRIQSVLDTYTLPPERFELELTEAMLLRSEDAFAELSRYNALDIGLILDDFGTGHTSLAGLKKLPINALKIDASFVRNLPGNEEDAAVCEVIIATAHALGMKVIAEGVETEAQFNWLAEHSCNEAQGYWISKPLPEDGLSDFLLQAAMN